MNLKVGNKFLKDLRKIDNILVLEQVDQFLKDVKKLNFNSLVKKYKVKKIVGYSKFYRVRFGDYRLGFELDKNVLFVLRILPRKDIYKYFP